MQSSLPMAWPAAPSISFSRIRPVSVRKPHVMRDENLRETKPIPAGEHGSRWGRRNHRMGGMAAEPSKSGLSSKLAGWRGVGSLKSKPLRGFLWVAPTGCSRSSRAVCPPPSRHGELGGFAPKPPGFIALRARAAWATIALPLRRIGLRWEPTRASAVRRTGQQGTIRPKRSSPLSFEGAALASKAINPRGSGGLVPQSVEYKML